MKKLWQTYAAKIDALSLRERLMVFITALVACVVVMAMLFVDGPLSRKKTLLARTAQRQTELQTLQRELQTLTQRPGADAANIARRGEINQEIARADQTLKDVQKRLVPAQEMKGVLQEVLASNTRLQLVGMRTLAVTPLVERNAKSDKTDAPAAGAAVQETNVFKHGVVITIEGSYADLHDYLTRLEKLPWRMLWSRATLNAADYPHLTLTVTIYTLSLDKAWLVV